MRLNYQVAFAGLILFFFFSSRRRHTRFDCDWSSDVCSSDLTMNTSRSLIRSWSRVAGAARRLPALVATIDARVAAGLPPRAHPAAGTRRQIGRASCRERVEISVVAVSLKKKNK